MKQCSADGKNNERQEATHNEKIYVTRRVRKQDADEDGEKCRKLARTKESSEVIGSRRGCPFRSIVNERLERYSEQSRSTRSRVLADDGK